MYHKNRGRSRGRGMQIVDSGVLIRHAADANVHSVPTSDEGLAADALPPYARELAFGCRHADGDGRRLARFIEPLRERRYVRTVRLRFLFHHARPDSKRHSERYGVLLGRNKPTIEDVFTPFTDLHDHQFAVEALRPTEWDDDIDLRDGLRVGRIHSRSDTGSILARSRVDHLYTVALVLGTECPLY